jgi:glutamate racemase
MKIGIFDSGLGGLVITHSLIRALPQYDYLYLGDTARVPYGNRSSDIIYQFTREAVDYLFRQDCALIIIACNTASAEALRRVQQEYLPANYPDRRVLGVLIPAAEEAAERSHSGKIGVLATQATIESGAFIREVRKLRPEAQIVQQPAPLLVPLIECDALQFAGPILDWYLEPLEQSGVDSLILGCTHYPLLRDQIEERVGEDMRIVDQRDFVPDKLRDYLHRHPEMECRLTHRGDRQFQLTDRTSSAVALAERLFGHEIELERIATL